MEVTMSELIEAEIGIRVEESPNNFESQRELIGDRLGIDPMHVAEVEVKNE